jgi:hypothetical protein
MTLPNRPGYSVERSHAVPVNGTRSLPGSMPPPPPSHLPPSPSPLLPGHLSPVPPPLPFHMTQQPQLLEEEIQQKKKYLLHHRLLPSVLALLVECKKEGLVGQINPDVAPSYYCDPRQFSLDDFLENQGITPTDLEAQNPKDPKTEEFIFKFEQLKQRYKEELDKLGRVCDKFCALLMALLREQSHFRPVTDHEIQLKLGEMQRKFDYVRFQLKNSVCNAIQMLQRQYNQPKKKRRQLSKQATEILNNWFYEHINDPYPTDEEKNILASKCLLSINQINNWFGNKRIRNKRKTAKLMSMKNNNSGNVVLPLNPDSAQYSEDSPSISGGGGGSNSVSGDGDGESGGGGGGGTEGQLFDDGTQNPKRFKFDTLPTQPPPE